MTIGSGSCIGTSFLGLEPAGFPSHPVGFLRPRFQGKPGINRAVLLVIGVPLLPRA